jgi:hypothetical protein
MRNRRSEPRFFADQAVTVSVLDSNKGESGPGTIVDFSASGIGIHAPFQLAAGCKVEIKWPRGVVLAEVRYCRPMRPGKFRVGLKIAEVVALAGISGQSGAA